MFNLIDYSVTNVVMLVPKRLLIIAFVLGIAVFLIQLREIAVSEAQTVGSDRLVRGQVINKTTGDASISNLVVVLHQHGPSQRNDVEVMTDSEGYFHFQNVKFDPAVQYGVSVVYQGAMYGVDINLTDGSSEPVLLEVYNAVQDQDMMFVSDSSFLLAQVDQLNRGLWGLEIVKLQNRGDSTYAPGSDPMSLIRFGLPTGSTKLQVDSSLYGSEVIQVDRGFALDVSVPPGNHDVMYSYHFSYRENKVEIEKLFPYGAETVRILVPYGIAQIRSLELDGPRIIDVGGKPYLLMEGHNIGRGERISIAFLDLPEPSTSQLIQLRLRGIRFEYFALVCLVLLMGTIVTFSLLRRDKLKN